MSIFRDDQTRETLTMSKEPMWDRQRRELRIGDVVVKRFRWPAKNQEKVLNAFADLQWPTRIDDPLPRDGVNAKSKLHDTIKCLNKNQEIGLIKFRGDGTGKGVLVEIVSREEAERRAAVKLAADAARAEKKRRKKGEGKTADTAENDTATQTLERKTESPERTVEAPEFPSKKPVDPNQQNDQRPPQV